jgi:holo-[acyl-carrier protein] synthase
MLAKGVGIDIVEVERLRRAVCRNPGGFRRRVFTPGEWQYCCGGGKINFPSLAARFAGKEAVLKALGCGWPEIPWREIEIVKGGTGPPEVHLGPLARAKAAERGICSILITLSHTKSQAIAQALAQGRE